MKKIPSSLWGSILFGTLFLCAAVVAASEGGGHGEAVHWAATDTYRWINFAILFGVMAWAFVKYIKPMITGRIQGIKDELAGLEEKKAAAAKDLAEITGRLSSLENEAQRIVADYVRQGEEAKARIIKEAQAASERISEQAKRSMEQEFAQAKERLRLAILERAMVMGEDMVKTSITSQDQDRLVGEYIEKVVVQ